MKDEKEYSNEREYFQSRYRVESDSAVRYSTVHFRIYLHCIVHLISTLFVYLIFYRNLFFHGIRLSNNILGFSLQKKKSFTLLYSSSNVRTSSVSRLQQRYSGQCVAVPGKKEDKKRKEKINRKAFNTINKQIYNWPIKN